MNAMTGDIRYKRRELIQAAAASGLAAALPAWGAAEPPPETTRIRIDDVPTACVAPLFVAEPLLRAEGFTQVEYVKTTLAGGPLAALAAGQLDLCQEDPAECLRYLDRGAAITVLGGVHTGCYELFAQTSIRSLRELKGKSIAAPEESSRQAFVATMLASVGLDPRKDVTWINYDAGVSMALFEQGKIDAFIGFVPEPQVLRAKKVGHVLIDTYRDKPWSQYFCCLATSNREFVRKYPVATKRALRAVLKAIDLCVSQPERAARLMVERGLIVPNFEHALAAVRDMGYARWRDYEAEDTMRYWGLRMREFGYVKSDPKTLLARGTDWRFIKALKKELKA